MVANESGCDNAAALAVPTLGRTLETLRRLLFLLLTAGLAGTGAELLLLEHTEGFWQKVPLLLVAAGLGMLVLLLLLPRAAAVRLFQATMVLLMVSAFIGLFMHFRGNLEFEQELHPGQTGMKLIKETLMGATPALAPGMMLLLGALGFACTYQHPALAPRPHTKKE